MKVLFIVSGTKRIAATRYRVYQYLPYLESQGIRYNVLSVISDFSTRLAIRSPELGEIARLAYYILVFIEKLFRFWTAFFAAPHYDAVFLQRVTFAFGLGKLLKSRNKNIIFDIDDAIFLPDTMKQNIVTRLKVFIKEKELREILDISKCVIVENDYIAEYVSRYCGKVYKIPGPIDTERYFVKTKIHDSKASEVILGWIGSPATTAYLHILDNIFAEIFSRFSNIKIVLIGAGKYGFPNENVISKNWDYETEVEELQRFDIGLMPMPNDKWTKGKLGCKMLQYMAVGVPSVVSYTPTNAELIENGKNGFLINTESEWINVLSRLVEDENLRLGVGIAGRRTVEALCSVQKNGPRLLEILKSLE